MSRHHTIPVTGAPRGIGRAVAKQAGERGWEIAVNYRTAAEVAGRILWLRGYGASYATGATLDIGGGR